MKPVIILILLDVYLPRDSSPEKHLEIIFNKATELNLDVEAHLDQLNVPVEKETEMFCDFVEKYNYQGKVELFIVLV